MFPLSVPAPGLGRSDNPEIYLQTQILPPHQYQSKQHFPLTSNQLTISENQYLRFTKYHSHYYVVDSHVQIVLWVDFLSTVRYLIQLKCNLILEFKNKKEHGVLLAVLGNSKFPKCLITIRYLIKEWLNQACIKYTAFGSILPFRSSDECTSPKTFPKQTFCKSICKEIKFTIMQTYDQTRDISKICINIILLKHNSILLLLLLLLLPLL